MQKHNFLIACCLTFTYLQQSRDLYILYGFAKVDIISILLQSPASPVAGMANRSSRGEPWGVWHGTVHLYPCQK